MNLSKTLSMNTFPQKVIKCFDFQRAIITYSRVSGIIFKNVIKLVCWNSAHYKLVVEILKPGVFRLLKGGRKDVFPI